jgi:carbonic anhydrase
MAAIYGRGIGSLGNDTSTFNTDAAFDSHGRLVALPYIGAFAQLAHGQHPYATILGCSDSRVPPELISDTGLGELFVVRVAGNVLSPEVSGSLQYAGAHLNTSHFVILGHDGCDAVKAALDTKVHGIQQRSCIQILVDDIMPGLSEVDPQLPPSEQLERAVEANVRCTMRQILETPEAQAQTAEGRMKLVGGIFDIASGHVRFLSLC